MIESTIFFTTSFIGLHHWPKAPDFVAYLRDPHRHEFKVRVEMLVTHNDRELEFIKIKAEVDEWLRERLTKFPRTTVTPDLGTSSCEAMAAEIIGFLERQERYSGRVCSVEVSEDGENGAVLRYRR